MTLNVNAPDFLLPNDLQAIYDHVAQHLLNQKRVSAREVDAGRKQCCYRSPNGDKCAVGALIPDARYSPGLEGWRGPYVLAVLDLLPWTEMKSGSSPRVRLLNALQQVHDSAIMWQEREFVVALWWKEELFRIARDFHLFPFTRDVLTFY